MSIINDALKKVQKRQAQGQSSLTPPGVTPGGAPGSSQAMPSQLFVLFALGAIVLIALSVLGTVYLLRRPAAPAVAQAPAAPATSEEKIAPVPVVRPTPSAVVTAPPTIPVATPQPPQPVAPAPAPVLEKSLPPAAPSNVSVVTATPAAPPAVESPAVAIAPPLDPTKPDPKIVAYVDALQIAGVRITSTSSKVLMNDRVFRQNDVVDRMLGLRLKKIGDETLTFVDERGVTYTKNF